MSSTCALLPTNFFFTPPSLVMRTIFKAFLLLLAINVFFSLFTACEHEPILPDNPGDTTTNPIDTTTNPIDTTTTPIDTSTTGGNPCLPNVVYFERDVLPILLSNCAYSGCHDAASHQDGVVLNNYNNVVNTGDVKPYNLNGSDLYEVITETDPDKRMPPPPNAALSAAQIATIGQWILQGAQNLTCDENGGGCNTTNVSFAATVLPIIQNYCSGCHSGSSPQGGVLLTNYNQIAAAATVGSLIGTIKGTSGYTPMPFMQPPLNTCFIQKIEAWVTAGAPNN